MFARRQALPSTSVLALLQVNPRSVSQWFSLAGKRKMILVAWNLYCESEWKRNHGKFTNSLQTNRYRVDRELWGYKPEERRLLILSLNNYRWLQSGTHRVLSTNHFRRITKMLVPTKPYQTKHFKQLSEEASSCLSKIRGWRRVVNPMKTSPHNIHHINKRSLIPLRDPHILRDSTTSKTREFNFNHSPINESIKLDSKPKQISFARQSLNGRFTDITCANSSSLSSAKSVFVFSKTNTKTTTISVEQSS